MDKVRDEMAKSKNAQVQYLGEGVTALLKLYPGAEKQVGAEGKSLTGCMDAIRHAAKSGVADPATATEAICKYYGLDFKDYRRLAAEVNAAMCGVELTRGGEQAGNRELETEATAAPATEPTDAFDLDALMGGM